MDKKINFSKMDTVARAKEYREPEVCYKILCEWVARERKNVRYAYQFDKRLVDAFLDYVFLDRDNTIRTRNNYLNWLKSFSTWMLGKCFIEQDPTQGIPQMKNRSGKKNRDVIPDGVLQQIHDYLMERNRHYLLACYLLHYLFVRPHEISMLKIEDFSLRNKTLLIHGDIAKNWQDAVVTLPSIKSAYSSVTPSFSSST